VVINSSAGDLSMPHHRLRFENLPKLAASVASRDLVDRELGILSLTTTNHGSDRGLAEVWARYLEERRPRPQVAVAQIAAALRFRAPKSLPVPSLFLTSEGDRFTAPACSRRLAERYRSPIFVHPSAGHDLPLDDPDWVASRVSEWIGR
jgi:pimeloyl-ACP methyl ester carboxylesterase